MIIFSNAKINLGLHIIAKRSDNYHDIETVMIPVGLYDIIEFVVSEEGEIFNISGIKPDCSREENLVIKALRLLKKDFQIPDLKIHLHKNIPPGTGLGGGSSNAAFMLKGLNDYFELGINDNDLESYASLLGSDCPMFVRNKSCLASGRGDVLTAISLDFPFYIVLLYPGFTISTKEVYHNVIPDRGSSSLSELIKEDPLKWKGKLKNRLEDSVFLKYPQLSNIKLSLYEEGAVYASMSGSGSVIYALFENKPVLKSELAGMILWEGLRV